MDITQKEFDRMRVRRTETDINMIFWGLKTDGEVRIVADVVKVVVTPESIDVEGEMLRRPVIDPDVPAAQL